MATQPVYSFSGGAILPQAPAPTPPAGWDATTYANFKKANPNLEPTAEDTARMQGTYQPNTPADFNKNYNLQIPNPTPPPTGAQAPTLPTPTAPNTHETYMGSATADAAAARSTLEAAYKAQSDELQKKIDASQGKIDALNTTEQGVITDNIQPLTQPFRDALETAQRESLHVNENFEANQKLVDELDSLLTQGNQLIAQQKSFGGVSFVRDARVQKTMTDVAARAGVIQAVMAARNSQISVAETMIDRSVAAINADRNDQIDYYKTLLSFYDSQKGDEQKNLTTLQSDQKDYLKAQISLLENDAKRTQEYADNIKKAMVDPDTAQAYAQAGVTLNDSPEVISKKLSDYAYTNEVRDQSNKMAETGFTYLLPGQKAPTGSEVVTTTDSRGTKKTYYKLSATAASAKTPNATQTTYGNYAPRLESADGTINSLTDAITKIPAVSFALAQRLPSFLQSSDIQQYNQAKTNFINAVLRQESGAAIADSERASYESQYFPMPGDSAATIAQKAQNRAQVIASYKQAAGPAYAPPVASSSGTDQYASYRAQLQPGEILISRNGQVGKIPAAEFNASTDKKL